MDKATHAAKLRAAMASRGADRSAVVGATGVAVRTVTNWTTGKTMPSNTERAALRRLFPGYDEPGDPVEVSIMGSGLTEDRKYALVGEYKRMLREQGAEGNERSA